MGVHSRFCQREGSSKTAFSSVTGNAFQPTLKEQVNSQMLLAATKLPASVVYSRFIVFLVCLLDAHASDTACSYCETSCLPRRSAVITQWVRACQVGHFWLGGKTSKEDAGLQCLFVVLTLPSAADGSILKQRCFQKNPHAGLGVTEEHRTPVMMKLQDYMREVLNTFLSSVWNLIPAILHVMQLMTTCFCKDFPIDFHTWAIFAEM